VIGGRWKPLHHFLADATYSDVIVSCGVGELQMGDAGDSTDGPALCYARNDLPYAVQGSISVNLVRFKDGVSAPLTKFDFVLPPGGGAIKFFCASLAKRHQHNLFGSSDSSSDDGSTLRSEIAPSECHQLTGLVAGFAGCETGGAACILNVSWTYKASRCVRVHSPLFIASFIPFSHLFFFRPPPCRAYFS